MINKNLLRIGEIVKAKRRECDLGLREVSDQSGISTATLSRIERGKGSVGAETLTKLSTWLDASVADLLVGDSDKLEKLNGMSTPQMVAVCVRADLSLSDSAKDALVRLFDVAYLQLTEKGE